VSEGEMQKENPKEQIKVTKTKKKNINES